MVQRTRRSRYLLPLGALGILAAEYLAITLRFDAEPLLDQPGAWNGLGWAGLLGPAVIAFGTALWILGGTELRAAFARAGSTVSDAPPLAARLGLHALCFAAFYAVTTLVFAQQPPTWGSPELWTLLWLIGGAATVLSLVPVAAGGLRVLPVLRELAVPLGVATLLAVVAWGAGLASVYLWRDMSDVTLHAVASALGILVSPIYFQPATAEIGTPDFWVEVAPVCSGYEGIGLILVFLSAYLAVFHKRLRFPQVLLLIPAAIVLIWLLNVLRIVALILVGHFLSPEVAIGGFHSKAGWLVFCGVALGAVWLTQKVPWFAADPGSTSDKVTNPSAPFLLPLLAVVATALVTGLFIDTFDYFYPLRVVIALLVLAWYRDDYLAGFRAHLRGRPALSWHAVGIGVAVYVVWIAVSAFTVPGLAMDAPDALQSLTAPLAIAWIVARALGSIVTVPIIEELAFRGFLLRRLIGRDFNKVPYGQWSWLAVLISSLAFAAAHQQWIGGLVAGILYAYAQKRRGLLSDAIIAHAVTNALIALQVLVLGHWTLW
jgi:exosortase E/protease (VPEID-CTERM system)